MFDLPNEKTLLGALESYISTVVHVRPYLASSYRDVLEDMAEQWLGMGGMNAIAAVPQAWLAAFTQQADALATSALRKDALNDFFGWALREGLVPATA